MIHYVALKRKLITEKKFYTHTVFPRIVRTLRIDRVLARRLLERGKYSTPSRSIIAYTRPGEVLLSRSHPSSTSSSRGLPKASRSIAGKPGAVVYRT